LVIFARIGRRKNNEASSFSLVDDGPSLASIVKLIDIDSVPARKDQKRRLGWAHYMA
jgi:hypothetical protein